MLKWEERGGNDIAGTDYRHGRALSAFFNEMIEASLGGAKVQRHKRGTGSMYSFQRIAEGQV
jgi:hypothetical protein